MVNCILIEPSEKDIFILQLRNAIYGIAIGDALGVPVEFKTREVLSLNPVQDMQDGYLPKGTYSDDTAMTLCTLASLQENDWALNLNDIMTKFLEWKELGYLAVDEDVFDIGITTSRALSRFKNGFSIEQCGSTSFYECGNGSLMRIMPIVFYLKKHPEADVYETVKQVSSLTHAHEICTIGCYIYVKLCLAILNNKPRNGRKKLVFRELIKIKEEISCLVDEKWIDSYARIFDVENFANLPVDEIKSDGYVVHSLEAALWCFLNTDDYRACVLKAVNLGSDSDTTAAIAGGLSGLYYDYVNIPNEWTQTLRNKEVINELIQLRLLCIDWLQAWKGKEHN